MISDVLTPHEMLKEAGRIGYYADGNYVCRCLACERAFTGDKRACECLPCAVKRLSRFSDLAIAAQPIIAKLERHEALLVARYSKLGSEHEEFRITAGEARALRQAYDKAFSLEAQ
jgi:hypothetical protein